MFFARIAQSPTGRPDCFSRESYQGRDFSAIVNDVQVSFRLVRSGTLMNLFLEKG